MSEEKKERDYPEVQFTLAGDEGKSEEQIQKEIEMIIKKRDLSIALAKLGWDDGEKEEENSNEQPRRTR